MIYHGTREGRHVCELRLDSLTMRYWQIVQCHEPWKLIVIWYLNWVRNKFSWPQIGWSLHRILILLIIRRAMSAFSIRLSYFGEKSWILNNSVFPADKVNLVFAWSGISLGRSVWAMITMVVDKGGLWSHTVSESWTFQMDLSRFTFQLSTQS